MKDRYIGITQPLNIVKKAYSNIDSKYGPYDSIEDALAAIPISLRKEGLTVGILVNHDIIEHWFDGGIEDIHLVQKTANKIYFTNNYFDSYEDGILSIISTTPEINNSIITLIDSYTKESVLYEEVNIWQDGTSMDNYKIDNVIYRKKGNKFFVDTSYFNSLYLDIDRFNIIGDGLNDDTDILLKILSLSKNKIINIDNKNLVVSSTLYPKQGCKLIGYNSSIKNNNLAASGNNDIKQLFSIQESDITIKGFNIINTELNGNSTPEFGSDLASNICVGRRSNLYKISNILIEDIIINNGIINTSAIIIFGNIHNSIIRNVEIWGNFMTSFHSEWNSPTGIEILNPTNISWINCKVYNNTKIDASDLAVGFFVSGNIGALLLNCQVYNSETSYYIYTGDRGTNEDDNLSTNLVGCMAFKFITYGMQILGSEEPIDNTINVNILNCMFEGSSTSTSTGILMSKVNNVNIDNLTNIKYCRDGIYISLSKGIKINNLILREIYNSSLFIYSSENIVVSNTEFIDTTKRQQINNMIINIICRMCINVNIYDNIFGSKTPIWKPKCHILLLKDTNDTTVNENIQIHNNIFFETYSLVTYNYSILEEGGKSNYLKVSNNIQIGTGYKVSSRNIDYGLFEDRPTEIDDNIEIGHKYFCTDKQTTEGTTNGIEINYKGTNVWVDALGRVIV